MMQAVLFAFGIMVIVDHQCIMHDKFALTRARYLKEENVCVTLEKYNFTQHYLLMVTNQTNICCAINT